MADRLYVQHSAGARGGRYGQFGGSIQAKTTVSDKKKN